MLFSLKAICLYIVVIFVEQCRSAEEGYTDYVLNGGNAEITCIPKEAPKPFKSPFKYKWSGKGLQKSRATFTTDTNSGSLIMNNTVVWNTGDYECQLSNEEGAMVIYRHRIVVYEMPSLYEKTKLSYRAYSCKPEVEDEKMAIVRKALCLKKGRGLCIYQMYSYCQNLDYYGHRKEYRLKVIITNSVPRYFTHGNCKDDKICIIKKRRNVFKKYQQQLNEFIKKEAESAEESSEYLYSSVIRYEADLKRNSWGLECPGGYKHLFNKDTKKHPRSDKIMVDENDKCVPCEPGTFSPPGETVCHSCFHDTYQDGYGHVVCKRCPKGKETEGHKRSSIHKCFAENELKRRMLDHHNEYEQVHRQSFGYKLPPIKLVLICTVVLTLVTILMCVFMKKRKAINVLIREEDKKKHHL